MKDTNLSMPPSKSWSEQIGPDEKEQFAGYAKTIVKIQQDNTQYSEVERALHVKRHVGACAKFKVYEDIPDIAKIGIFKSGGEFDAWVRFSNGAVKRQADKKPDVRGMAIKVLGVPGKKLVEGKEDAITQDFSMIQSPAVSFGNSDGFMFFTSRAATPFKLLIGAVLKFGPLRTWRILAAVFSGIGKKIVSLSEIKYWSALPISLGEYAIKYSVVPVLKDNEDGREREQPENLGSELEDRLKSGVVEFELGFQFYVDSERTPIEDSAVEWDEKLSPFIGVARLTLPQQDLRSEEGERQQTYVESLAFDPWNAPIEFKPLGNLMRARGFIYRYSTQARGAIPEPTKMEHFDCLM